jgi:hypothetical protein
MAQLWAVNDIWFYIFKEGVGFPSSQSGYLGMGETFLSHVRGSANTKRVAVV